MSGASRMRLVDPFPGYRGPRSEVVALILASGRIGCVDVEPREVLRCWLPDEQIERLRRLASVDVVRS